MNIQKLISELQERNRERFEDDLDTAYHCNKLSERVNALNFPDYQEIADITLDQITIDSFNQGALAVIEEIYRWVNQNKADYPVSNHSWDYAVLADELKDYLKTLEAKLKDND